ncbi:MAG: polymer-forming cytoskeletal protein [Hyphomicrobium sp.]|nr:polymer-forming cytoskeletal protein [Hyphomicrobium sp.]
MFNRGPGSDNVPPKPPTPLSTSPLAPSATGGNMPSGRPISAAFDRSSNAAGGTSVIGTDLTIMGEKIMIISQNKLTVDGDVHGDIHGRQVVIGEEGSVIGTVSAESIEVRGGVKGAIRAQNVTLHPTAQVEGDISHSTLSISEGAQFDGRVRRAKDASELKPNLDVSAFETLRISALGSNGGG